MTAAETKERELLTDAVLAEDQDAIKELIQRGFDINKIDGFGSTPLILAVVGGNINLVLFLIENGAKIDKKNDEGDTALHAAIRKCDVEMTRQLLAKGAATNEKGYDGATSLICAILSDSQDLVTLLLENGVDPEETDEQGRSPLKWAVDRNDVGIEELLISAIAMVHRRKAEEARLVLSAEDHTRATAQRQLLKKRFPHKLTIRTAP